MLSLAMPSRRWPWAWSSPLPPLAADPGKIVVQADKPGARINPRQFHYGHSFQDERGFIIGKEMVLSLQMNQKIQFET